MIYNKNCVKTKLVRFWPSAARPSHGFKERFLFFDFESNFTFTKPQVPFAELYFDIILKYNRNLAFFFSEKQNSKNYEKFQHFVQNLILKNFDF